MSMRIAAIMASVVTTAAAQQCNWLTVGGGADDPVFTFTTFDDGTGEALYLGGSFQTVELTLIVNYVAKWDGRSWSALGPGLRSGLVFDLAVFDDGHGGGPALYAGGSFETSGGRSVRGIAKWDGASWSEVGGGIAGGATKPAVRALCVFDDGSGPSLYAGGTFGSVGGAPETSFIARWDGESWSSVGGGMHSWVYALQVHDDGRGAALYAGGTFLSAGGVPAQRMAKWDGAAWSPLGEGLNGYPTSLAVFDDGSGPALYVGGIFTRAGGAPIGYLAQWDGSSWSEVGGGLDKGVSGLAGLDDGSGSALYVGGPFTTAGTQTIRSPVKWDGRRWTELHGAGSGLIPLSASVYTVFDDGRGPALYAGGSFEAEPGGWQLGRRQYIARFDCPTSCPADCDRSGDLTFFDFLCFQNLFVAMDPGADCDGDSAFTFFDFLCFQNAFAAGCP